MSNTQHVTALETDSADLVRAIHATGHAIKLTRKGPIRYWYSTSMASSEVRKLATSVDARSLMVSPLHPVGVR